LKHPAICRIVLEFAGCKLQYMDACIHVKSGEPLLE